VPQMRQEYQSPRLLSNLEKAIAMVPWSAERIEVLRSRMPGYRDRILKDGKA